MKPLKNSSSCNLLAHTFRRKNNPIDLFFFPSFPRPSNAQKLMLNLVCVSACGAMLPISIVNHQWLSYFKSLHPNVQKPQFYWAICQTAVRGANPAWLRRAPPQPVVDRFYPFSVQTSRASRSEWNRQTAKGKFHRVLDTFSLYWNPDTFTVSLLVMKMSCTGMKRTWTRDFFIRFPLIFSSIDLSRILYWNCVLRSSRFVRNNHFVTYACLYFACTNRDGFFSPEMDRSLEKDSKHWAFENGKYRKRTVVIRGSRSVSLFYSICSWMKITHHCAAT